MDKFLIKKRKLSENESEVEVDTVPVSSENPKKSKKKKTPDLAAFWLPLVNEYPTVAKTAVTALLPFSTSYACEAAFSTINQIKNKNRSQLQTVEHNTRLALSIVQPRKTELVKKHQAHISH